MVETEQADQGVQHEMAVAVVVEEAAVAVFAEFGVQIAPGRQEAYQDMGTAHIAFAAGGAYGALEVVLVLVGRVGYLRSERASWPRLPPSSSASGLLEHLAGPAPCIVARESSGQQAAWV